MHDNMHVTVGKCNTCMLHAWYMYVFLLFIYYMCNMHVLSNMHVTCMLQVHACFAVHACNMPVPCIC